jgi:hypothetical protein
MPPIESALSTGFVFQEQRRPSMSLNLRSIFKVREVIILCVFLGVLFLLSIALTALSPYVLTILDPRELTEVAKTLVFILFGAIVGAFFPYLFSLLPQRAQQRREDLKLRVLDFFTEQIQPVSQESLIATFKSRQLDATEVKSLLYELVRDGRITFNPPNRSYLITIPDISPGQLSQFPEKSRG